MMGRDKTFVEKKTIWRGQIFGQKRRSENKGKKENLAVFGPKILIFTGVSKSFSTNIMEKPHKQLVCIDFCSGIRLNGPNLAIFGPNLAVFGPKIQFFGGRE